MSEQKPNIIQKTIARITGVNKQLIQKQSELDITSMQLDSLRNENYKLRQVQLAQPSFIQWRGVPRVTYAGGEAYDYIQSRMLASTPTPRMCIKRKKQDVMNTLWEITPLPNSEGKITETAKQHAKAISDWLYFRPNWNQESFAQIIGKVSEDLDVHDAATITKTYAAKANKHLVQIHARDSALFTKDIDTYLNLGVVTPFYEMDGKRYKNLKVGYWYNWNADPKVAYEPHEVVYLMDDPRTDIPYGTSPMYTLRSMLHSLMYSDEFYQAYWQNGAKNPCIIGPDVVSSTSSSGVMLDADFQKYKIQLKEQMQEYMTRAVTNSKTNISMLSDPKTLGWLEQQDSYIRLCTANMNMTPVAIGYTKDIQKSTEESQMSLYIQRGLWPRLKNIEWYMNTQVIADWFWTEKPEYAYTRNGKIKCFSHEHKGRFAGQPMDVMFRFKLYDPVGEAKELELTEKRLKAGLTSFADALKKHGLPNVSWKDIMPLFCFNPQQWGQSYTGGAIDADLFKRVTGIEPAVKDLVAATTPNFNEPETATEAFQESRADKLDMRLGGYKSYAKREPQ